MIDLIEEIHAIREDNYNTTKDMSNNELIEYTKEQARPIIERLKEMKHLNEKRTG